MNFNTDEKITFSIYWPFIISAYIEIWRFINSLEKCLVLIGLHGCQYSRYSKKHTFGKEKNKFFSFYLLDVLNFGLFRVYLRGSKVRDFASLVT